MKRLMQHREYNVPEEGKQGHVVLAMCHGKEPLTWAHAKAILDRTPRKGRKKVAYHCPICRAWHVGSPIMRRKGG